MPARAAISLLSCVFALILTGCSSGSNGTIPQGEAENLLSLVASIQNDVSDGDCDTAQNHAQELVSEVDTLPDQVDTEVANELDKASKQLEQLASTDCVESGATGPSDQQEPLDATSTTSTETVEPTTEETSTTTDEEQTPPDQPTEQPQEQPPTGDQGPQGTQGTPGTQGGAGGSGTGGPASGGITGGGNAG